MAKRDQRHAYTSKQTMILDGIYVCGTKWHACQLGLNHEGMNDISNVTAHLRTCSGNVNNKT